MRLKEIAPVPTEHAEQVALFSWARYSVGRYPELDLLFAIPNAGGFSGGFKNNARRVQRLIDEGLKPGMPDTCLPVSRGGFHSLYVELKRRRGGSVKESQHDVKAALEAAGNKVVICKGWEEARAAILDYLALEGGAE